MLVKTKPWTRRRFLRAAGITAAGALLPFVPSLRASAYAPARRLVLFSTGNGTWLPNWRSNGPGSAFTHDAPLPALEGPILSPLERHRDRVILLDGLDLRGAFLPTANDVNNRGHSSPTVLWTGAPGESPDAAAAVGENPAAWADGASVDQLVAQRFTGATRFDSLVMSTSEARRLTDHTIYHYRGPDQPVTPERDPRALFERLWGSVVGPTADEAAAARRLRERGSVVSLLRGEMTRLRSELADVDRDRLDHHLEGLDALERELAAPAVSCEAPESPGGASGHPRMLNAFFDIVQHAFQCDLTRVACVAFGGETGNNTIDWLPGRSFGFHSRSHDLRDTNNSVRDGAISDYTALNEWWTEQFAGLMDRLSSSPGAEQVLDDTIAAWGMGMSHGGFHSSVNPPFVLVQGVNGPWRTGRYLRWGSVDAASPPYNWRSSLGTRPNNELLVSICRGMGLDDVDRVGDARIESGPLPELM
jgi:hypothetical protein